MKILDETNQQPVQISEANKKYIEMLDSYITFRKDQTKQFPHIISQQIYKGNTFIKRARGHSLDGSLCMSHASSIDSPMQKSGIKGRMSVF